MKTGRSLVACVSRIGLLACDLDGTLVGRDHKINDADRAAILGLQATGVRVAVCTGRSLMESAGILADLELGGLGVFVTGAMVHDMGDGKAVVRTTLSDKTAAALLAFFAECGHAVVVLVAEDSASGSYYVVTGNGPVHPATADWFLRNRVSARQSGTLNPDLLSHIVRIGIVVEASETRRLESELLSRFGDRICFLAIQAPVFGCHVIEVFAPQVNKWSGILSMCRLLKIPPDSVATIGDEINDVPMLRQAGLSFAMATASPEVKRAAKRVTYSQREAGVAAAIEHILNENQASEL